jgi:hypothetical protein
MLRPHFGQLSDGVAVGRDARKVTMQKKGDKCVSKKDKGNEREDNKGKKRTPEF